MRTRRRSATSSPQRTAQDLVSFLAAVTLLARDARALKVAFLADTGIGNDKPGREWTDYLGNVRRPSYKVDGEECKTFDNKYCGEYSRARDVFALAQDAGADLIVHAGDLDYASSPTSWFRFLTENVWRRGGRYVALKGNHDVDGWDGVQDLWSGPRGYQRLLASQIPRGAKAYGSYGEDFAMEFGGVLIVMSSVGSENPGESSNKAHYEFLERALSQSSAKWKVCVWHMTMKDLQVSYKGDATGYGAYEICRKYGAFIVTGHSHVYSRSYTMKRFGTKVYGFTRGDLRVNDRDYGAVKLRPERDGVDGLTGLAVVGIGGYKNEAVERDSGIWAKVYSSQCLQSSSSCERAADDNKFGVLLCDFTSERDAECELRVVPRPGLDASRKRSAASAPSLVRDAFVLRRERA